jgi:hypothetical protein
LSRVGDQRRAQPHLTATVAALEYGKQFPLPLLQSLWLAQRPTAGAGLVGEMPPAATDSRNDSHVPWFLQIAV